ncbi:unknown protein [Cronobacter turicensis z3032]|jgi:hypothetical protein|uniref:Uncharacterized protein n=1 Tax=Cronobacter turicensis (strain DSM 18703 / CCUG 55852 / LMG 23827 / z3032) TaxID=693216 RepID=C9XXQ0_CROTZ|nr:unknown protein [Cronobacter turicensis z3032]
MKIDFNKFLKVIGLFLKKIINDVSFDLLMDEKAERQLSG